MRVQFLGTGGYHPNERRHTACIYLPDAGVVFDAGTAAFRLAPRLEQDDIDLFLSHAHLDHIVGLTYLLVPLGQGVLKTVRVHAAHATLAAVKEHLFAEPMFPVMPDFDFHLLEDQGPLVLSDGGALSHHPLVSHPGGSTAFRIDWPAAGRTPAKSLAYVTDTVVDGSYTAFIEGVDLLIHECYFPDELADWAEKIGHSHTTSVAQLAQDAGIGRLYLVHLDPQREQDDPIGIATLRAIHADTILAEDGMEIVL